MIIAGTVQNRRVSIQPKLRRSSTPTISGPTVCPIGAAVSCIPMKNPVLFVKVSDNSEIPFGKYKPKPIPDKKIVMKINK